MGKFGGRGKGRQVYYMDNVFDILIKQAALLWLGNGRMPIGDDGSQIDGIQMFRVIVWGLSHID